MKLRPPRFIRRRRLARALNLRAIRRRIVYRQTLALAAFFSKGHINEHLS